MKDDPLRKQLLGELKALRRSPGSLSVEQIAGSPTLVEVAGNGSVEQAYTTMLDVLEQQKFLEESDVVAYFASCGHGASGTTLESRLNDRAVQLFIDPRTVLRHSNRGAEKLSYIFRDMSVFNRPLGKINLLQKGNELACQIIIRFPKYSQYRKPDVYVDGNKHDGMSWDLVDDPDDESWSTAKETLFDQPLRIPVEADRRYAVWSIAVYWVMPVWASWATAMEISDPRLTTVLSITRNYRAELALFFDPSRNDRQPTIGPPPS
jgi:hypothetical protein